MVSRLHVHLLPGLVSPEELVGQTVVVIDVLRATTTIPWALANGAREVIPCLEVEDALAAAARFVDGDYVLGGERGGLPIEGFDLGNSPREYTRERVAGRTVIFTTTNGTRAMMERRRAKRVLLAAFVNVSAVERAVAEHDQINLLCAGTRGEITREDTLLAGWLVDRLIASGELELNDQARIARDAWRAVKPADPAALEAALRDTEGGRNLLAIRLGADIADAADIDRWDVVPELDVREWSIGDPFRRI